MPPKILVLQVRDDLTPRAQERDCFRRSVGHRGEVGFLNLPAVESIAWSDVEHADALMIGGAGAYTVTQRYSFTETLRGVLCRWIDDDRPFFGSCWGHHFLAWALGGSVVTDPASEEVGTFDIHLTEAGIDDPLLAGMPPVFKGQLGHHDRIDRLPEEAVELAYSARCRHQMLRVRDRHAYSTQFHPEMTADDLRRRLGMYADEYLADSATGASGPLAGSPEAFGLLARFLDALA